MALPARTLEEDRRLLYAIAEALGIASGIEFPTEFPPTPHAPTHEVGGSDVVTIADAQITSLDWSKLTGVPATFPPSAHAASHESGGADPVTLALIENPAQYRFEIVANGVQLVDLGGGDSRQLNAIGRINMTQHETGNASSVAWANGNQPNTGGAGMRSYASTDGARHMISYIFPATSREAYQTATFADEAQGVAETPRDYVLQEIFRLQDQMAAVIPYLISRNGPPLPNPFPAITDPYAAQSARPRNAAVGSIP